MDFSGPCTQSPQSGLPNSSLKNFSVTEDGYFDFSEKNLPSEQQVGGDHYRDMPIQPSEFIYRNGLNWMQGNAVKYICRHASKNGANDIDKAIHYLQLLKEWEYGDNA